MNNLEQIHMCHRYNRLVENGWCIKTDADRFRIWYPKKICEKYDLRDTHNLFISSSNLEAAICAAEAVEDFFDLILVNK